MLFGRIPFGRLLIGLSIVVGLLSYPSIRYMEYRTTYFQENEATNQISLNRKFQGNPIKDLGISFFNYEKHSLDYDKVTLTFKRNNSLNLPTCGFLNYLNYFLNWICMAVTCAFIFKIYAADSRYCSSCRKFYREKLLFQFRPGSYRNLLDELPNNLDNIEELQKKYQADVGNYRDYYQLYRAYCPKCKKGEIQIRHLVTEGNSLLEAENDRKIIPTSPINS
jgi:hypothetical protein